MACLYSNNNKIITQIPSYEIKDKITYYKITISVGDVAWSVTHRYNDFVLLHETLVKDYNVAKDILPPKKLLGTLDSLFLEKRKCSLEMYLERIVNFLEKTLPQQLIVFLHLNKYDINILLQEFATFCFQQGDSYCEKTNFTYMINPLQLHAMAKRFKQKRPVEESLHLKYDFSHILEFCSNLIHVIVQGSPSYIGTSNITYNQLTYEFSMFKKIQQLYMYSVDVSNISHLGSLRSTLQTLICSSSNLSTLSDILLCDQVHKTPNDTNAWTTLTDIDLSKNQIKQIDSSINLIPNVTKLNLESNQIEKLINLNCLKKLNVLNLNCNQIQDVSHLSVNLHCSSVTVLNLSENRLTNLQGMSKFINLETLNISSNFICDLEEIDNIKNLYKLINLNLTGNPIATIIDYRIKILQKFFKRVHQIVLDNEKPTSKEIDCTSVLNAICIAQGQTDDT